MTFAEQTALVNVTPTALLAGEATVKINGDVVVSGNPYVVPLQPSVNVVTINVHQSNLNYKSYTISITNPEPDPEQPGPLPAPGPGLGSGTVDQPALWEFAWKKGADEEASGSETGEFNAPSSMVTDSAGYVYVADRNRIQKFDHQGNYMLEWGGEGSGNGKFQLINGLAIRETGDGIRIYVSDEYRIQIFDADGAFIDSTGFLRDASEEQS